MAAAAVLTILSLSACGPEDRVPSLVGLALDDAHNTLTDSGFEEFEDRDHFADRDILWDANWVVVKQEPSSGKLTDLDQTIVLRVGKIGEKRAMELLPPDSPVRREAEASAALKAEAKAEKKAKAAAERAAKARAAQAKAAQDRAAAVAGAVPTPATASKKDAIVACNSRPPATGEILARYVTPDEPPTTQRLGGNWVWNFGDKKCITSTEFILGGNPPLPGHCTQVALVSDNPRYDENVRPAPRLRRVVAVRGDC